ncbi:MAG: hypothetical protein H7A46_08910 [Verrucomicrobiales bacterium]|nr:hypothetical protein [Verrucomicrobiales bacterium]
MSNPPVRPSWRALVAALGFVSLLDSPPVQAFPPAPHHTLSGLVRNEWGQPLVTEGAAVVLETAAGVTLHAAVIPGLGPDSNYRLRVPMDAGLTADNYRATALRPQVSFRMKVVIDGVVWLPIEMRGDFAQLGKPACSTRLDLTLGEDSDGDGLPDAWERALSDMLGGELSLAEIHAGDDSDGDGMSNLSEYLAGTYAFDPQDGFQIDLIEADDGSSHIEFTALRGRTYVIEGSPDLKQWRTVGFRLPDAAPTDPARDRYYAPAVRRMRLDVLREAESLRFFRLMVH